MVHPLDRPVWNALTTRQAHLARGTPRAWRLAPQFGLFAEAADQQPASLAALATLVPQDDLVSTLDRNDPATPPGLRVDSKALCHQMVATALSPREGDFEILDLTEADAPAMLALALRTRPGPFFSHTHQLGDFVGLKQNGALIAMAGERMKPPGFTEVSGVCTHPDHRNRGYAAVLMHKVASRILARGEIPFLNVYATNTGAILLYESLGFALRRTVWMTMLARLP